MTFSKAQLEFRIRRYIWAISEFEKEIRLSFPNLRLIKGGYTNEVYQLMQELTEKDQLLLAHALLKQTHPDAVTALGETISPEEQVMLGRCRVFTTTLGRKVDEEITESRRSGAKITFASKRKLSETMIKKVNETFGNRGVSVRDLGDLDRVFDIKCSGWIISTTLWFGRQESLIQYWQNIESEFQVRHPNRPELTVSAACLEKWMCWFCFNDVKRISRDDVDSTCDMVVRQCSQLIDVAPNLLKGLEAENIEDLKNGIHA